MKISLFIPKGKNKKQFLQKELSLCKNIKDKRNQLVIEQGLNKIIESYSDGYLYLFDNGDLFGAPYYGNEFLYYCGKKFKHPNNLNTKNKYLLVVVDANNYTVAELQGTKITVIYNNTSDVPGKSRPGGQSQQRYQRERQHKLVCWFKECAAKLKEYYYK